MSIQLEILKSAASNLVKKSFGLKFVVAKKADNLYPAVRGAIIYIYIYI